VAVQQIVADPTSGMKSGVNWVICDSRNFDLFQSLQLETRCLVQESWMSMQLLFPTLLESLDAQIQGYHSQLLLPVGLPKLDQLKEHLPSPD
jgi:hypothetical protein